jgi:glycosyltransferase involved in cell wall biosynthesis
MTPAISLIIPLYNNVRYIASTLRILRAQLSSRDEIIVVDDCSTDGSAAEAERLTDPQVRVIRTETNGGPATARNVGAQIARGDFLLFFDADDEPGSDMLQVLRDVVVEFPSEALFSFAISFEAHGERRRADSPKGLRRPITLLPQDAFAQSALRGKRLCTASSTCVSKLAFVQSGGFVWGLKYCEDPELWARLSSSYRMVFIPQALATYRDIPSSLSQIMRTKVGAVQPYVNTLVQLARSRGFVYLALARQMIRKNVVFALAGGANKDEVTRYIQTNRSLLGLRLAIGLYWFSLVPAALYRLLIRLRGVALRYNAGLRARHLR